MVVNLNGMMCSLWLHTAITSHHQWMALSLHSIFGHDPLEGRLSNLQNYCSYLGDQLGRLAVQENMEVSC